MERVNEIQAILRQAVADYSGPAFKAKTYYVEDQKQHIYIVVIVPDDNYPLNIKAGVVVMARIVGDRVVIDEDTTDRPLYEELMRQGIPREQIVLAYAGETIPDKDST
jgi:hypothetical protein